MIISEIKEKYQELNSKSCDDIVVKNYNFYKTILKNSLNTCDYSFVMINLFLDPVSYKILFYFKLENELKLFTKHDNSLSHFMLNYIKSIDLETRDYQLKKRYRLELKKYLEHKIQINQDILFQERIGPNNIEYQYPKYLISKLQLNKDLHLDHLIFTKFYNFDLYFNNEYQGLEYLKSFLNHVKSKKEALILKKFMSQFKNENFKHLMVSINLPPLFSNSENDNFKLIQDQIKELIQFHLNPYERKYSYLYEYFVADKNNFKAFKDIFIKKINLGHFPSTNEIEFFHRIKDVYKTNELFMSSFYLFKNNAKESIPASGKNHKKITLTSRRKR